MVTVCTASLTFSNSTFCSHGVFMCFARIWEQTAIISPYNINWLVSICKTDGVCFLRGRRDRVKAVKPVSRRHVAGPCNAYWLPTVSTHLEVPAIGHLDTGFTAFVSLCLQTNAQKVQTHPIAATKLSHSTSNFISSKFIPCNIVNGTLSKLSIKHLALMRN